VAEVGLLNLKKESQPYYIYKRLILNTPVVYFLHQIDYGFWYLVRQIHVKYPEVDASGLNFGPKLGLSFRQPGSNRWPQNIPVPDDLFCTPGSSGVTIFPGFEMTSTPLKGAKLQNISHPFRDNIEIQITGQNLVTPYQIDIMILGYYIPVESQAQWQGGFNG